MPPVAVKVISPSLDPLHVTPQPPAFDDGVAVDSNTGGSVNVIVALTSHPLASVAVTL